MIARQSLQRIICLRKNRSCQILAVSRVLCKDAGKKGDWSAWGTERVRDAKEQEYKT